MNLAASMQALPDLAAHPKVQRAVKYLPSVLTALLVVLIAWQLARLTWLVLPSPKMAEPVISAPVAAPVNTKRVNVQRIADAHLFGEATASDSPADAANAQQTQLPLVLAGVMASPEPTRGFAFIGESAAMAKFKRVGDALPGGARLHSVYVDRVMLDRGGRLESLLLPRYSGATALPPPVAATPPPTRFAENVRRLAESNPAAFSEIVRPQPVFVGSVQKGYRVYPGRNRQQFARLGLQPGDLVTAVNGTALSDQTNGMQIFNTISTMDRVSLTIERNGQTQQITVNTAQIDLPDANAPNIPPQDVSAPIRMPETAVQ